MQRAKQHERILGWVNRQRIALGLKPRVRLVKGKPGSAHTCVIAKSITGRGTAARSGLMHTRVRSQAIDHPVYISKFIRDFDRGKYPELIAK